MSDSGLEESGNRAIELPLTEDEDYYWEGELVIFTGRYLLRRGYCCEHGCRHCPYGYIARKQNESEVEGAEMTNYKLKNEN